MKSVAKSQLKIGVIFLIIAIILGLYNELSAQSRDEQITRARRELSVQADNYLTEFNGMRVSFVNPRVQGFLSEELEFSISGEPETSVAGDLATITETYVKKVGINGKADLNLKVKYTAIPQGDEFIIQSCEISGYDRYVIEFFIKYWKTSLNFEDVKEKEVVMNYWNTDRAALSADTKTKTATIKIDKQ